MEHVIVNSNIDTVEKRSLTLFTEKDSRFLITLIKRPKPTMLALKFPKPD